MVCTEYFHQHILCVLRWQFSLQDNHIRTSELRYVIRYLRHPVCRVMMLTTPVQVQYRVRTPSTYTCILLLPDSVKTITNLTRAVYISCEVGVDTPFRM